jgi:hypothetical protein
MTTTTSAPFEQAQRATEQVRDFNERVAGTSRAFGQLALDTYEQAVANFVGLEHKAAEAAPVDWVKSAISAHATLVEDLAGAYVRALREALA